MKKKICVIGAGRWGKNHIRTLDSLGALAGIVDSRTDTLDWFKEKYPQAQIYSDLAEAINGDFDGFTIATPAETHYKIAKELLRNGKPVLIEKPITLRVDQAREIAQLAKSTNVPVMVGHLMLFHPAIRKIKELLTTGKIGKLQYLYSNRVNLGTVRTEENILWSFAPHDISIFQYLTESTPSEVLARGGAFVQPHIHDSTMTILTYPDNITGHIFVSWLHPFKEHRLVVIGSKGMLSYDDSSADKHLLFYEKGVDWVNGEPVSRDGPTESIPYVQAAPLTEELSAYLRALDTNQVETASVETGVEVLEILHRASVSLTETNVTPSRQNTAPAANVEEYYAHPSSFIDQPVKIGAGTKIWHFSHIQSGSEIGKNCSIGQNVNIGNRVRIGNSVKIQNNVSIYEGVELEDYVFCGPSMVFTNILQPRSKFPQRGTEFYQKTLVREGASIGANATIVCGHMIGKHAFIAAGAVVTSDVPDYAMMIGVPARQTGWACECGSKLPEVKSKASCSKCGREYLLKGGVLSQQPGQGPAADSKEAANA